MKQLDLFASPPAIPRPGEDIESWKACPGFPRYEVSSNGRFRNATTLKQMSQGKDINGYPVAMLYGDGRQHCKLAHRLVCEAFHGPPPADKPMTNHLNRVKNDNRSVNLEWISRSANAKHWRRAEAAACQESSTTTKTGSFSSSPQNARRTGFLKVP